VNINCPSKSAARRSAVSPIRHSPFCLPSLPGTAPRSGRFRSAVVKCGFLAVTFTANLLLATGVSTAAEPAPALVPPAYPEKVIQKITQGGIGYCDALTRMISELGLPKPLHERVAALIAQYHADTEKWVKSHEPELSRYIGRLGAGHRDRDPKDYAAAWKEVKALTGSMPKTSDLNENIRKALEPDFSAEFEAKRVAHLRGTTKSNSAPKADG